MPRFLFALFLLSLPPAQAFSESWTVTPEQAQCILENKQAYLQDAMDVVIIPVAICPETDLAAAALSGKQNLGTAPDISTTGRDAALAFDEVIVYRAADLKCLSGELIQVQGEKAVLPRVVECGN